MAASGNTAEKIVEPDAAEPSMDEILASIRQIITDDEAQDDGKTERERYTHPDNPSNTNVEDSQPTAEVAEDALDRQMEAAVEKELSAAAEPAVATAGAAAAGALSLEERLAKYRAEAKERADSATAAAERAKAGAPLTDQPIPSLSGIGGPSASDVARSLMDTNGTAMNEQLEEMMRPVINQWLSDNLPTLVERLVRDEIERVSRGRRG